jgi:hypothetical protein
VTEFVPAYEASAVGRIAVPRNAPARVVELLNREISPGLAYPEMKAKFAKLAAAACSSHETEKWAKVVKLAGIKPE